MGDAVEIEVRCDQGVYHSRMRHAELDIDPSGTRRDGWTQAPGAHRSGGSRRVVVPEEISGPD